MCVAKWFVWLIRVLKSTTPVTRQKLAAMQNPAILREDLLKRIFVS